MHIFVVNRARRTLASWDYPARTWSPTAIPYKNWSECGQYTLVVIQRTLIRPQTDRRGVCLADWRTARQKDGRCEANIHNLPTTMLHVNIKVDPNIHLRLYFKNGTPFNQCWCMRFVCWFSKVNGANMGSPGSSRPQMGPMMAPWTLLSGYTVNTVNIFTMRQWFSFMSFVLHPLNAAVLANAILSIRLREMNKWFIVKDQDRCMGECGWWMQYECIHWITITSDVMEISRVFMRLSSKWTNQIYDVVTGQNDDQLFILVLLCISVRLIIHIY